MEDSSCDLISSALENISQKGNPYYNVSLLCLFVSLLVFVVSTITKNYSQVDKLWSIIPFVYTWMAVVDQRTLLMAIVATIWGVRLTYNFSRRGGYKWPVWTGDEDYRWKYIQEGHYLPLLKNQIAWMLFNLGFISIYQNILLLLIVTPSLVAWTVATDDGCTSSELNVLDFTAAFLVLFFVVVESIADNQQYKFQTEKYRKINAKEPLTREYADGFCQSGLFSIVRKPNYAAEQSIWVSYYIFSIAASGKVLNWSIIGVILLILLFQGSGRFTEKLTLMKYPEKYALYQKRVPLYVPNLLALGKSDTGVSETTPLMEKKAS